MFFKSDLVTAVLSLRGHVVRSSRITLVSKRSAVFEVSLEVLLNVRVVLVEHTTCIIRIIKMIMLSLMIRMTRTDLGVPCQASRSRRSPPARCCSCSCAR